MAEMLIIGIAGGSGSGKSTIARLLSEHFGGRVAVIRHDDYYRAQHDMPFEERAKQNYDHPDAFDTDLLLEHLAALRRGETIACPIYDYMEHDRTAETRLIAPADVLLIDGILILSDPAPACLHGYQVVRRYRRGYPYSPPCQAGREQTPPHAGVGHRAISHDGQAHARGVRRAE